MLRLANHDAYKGPSEWTVADTHTQTHTQCVLRSVLVSPEMLMWYVSPAAGGQECSCCCLKVPVQRAWRTGGALLLTRNKCTLKEEKHTGQLEDADLVLSAFFSSLILVNTNVLYY